MRSEEFRGHIEDCVRELNSRFESIRPKGSKGAASARQPIADFCGVRQSSVARWFRNAETLPNGTELIKLMCYLQLIGYHVIEWEKIPVARRNFAELVGFGIISAEQAREIIGYSTTTTTYQVLLGHYGSNKEKDRTMWDTWKSKMSELEQAKQRALQVCGLDLPKGQESKGISSKRSTVVISLIDSLITLLEDESFVSFEPDSVNFRSLTETVNKLSDKLNALRYNLIRQSELKGDG